MQRPTLIIIDMLNDSLETWPPGRRTELINAINRLVASMRAHGHPIIWVRQEFEADLSDAFLEMKRHRIAKFIKQSAGSDFVPGLHPQASDSVIIKKRYSAFFQTDLDQLLARQEADAIIIAGVNTHACIRMTAIDAYQRDWPVIIASDCVDSYDRAHHEITLRYFENKIARLLTSDEISKALAGA